MATPTTTSLEVAPEVAPLDVPVSNHDRVMMDAEVSIVNTLLSDVKNDPVDIKLPNKPLVDFMRTEMESRNFVCVQLERTLHLAANLIELAYHECSFTEKKIIALCNWYLIYVDDVAAKNPDTYGDFEQRFLRGQPQLDPVLDALVEVLMQMWGQYDALAANSIISASFDFVTTSCMEPDLEKAPLVQGTQRFSFYLRERTGGSYAYAFLLFPKSSQIGVTEYIQAMPDMCFWISMVNDLISFYKEELSGETRNYVHTRAYIEDKTPLTVLNNMAEEMQVSRDLIHKALSTSPKALQIWKVFERGYLAWYLTHDRYKLKELGIF